LTIRSEGGCDDGSNLADGSIVGRAGADCQLALHPQPWPALLLAVCWWWSEMLTKNGSDRRIAS